jgi:signal peptidase I
MADVTSVPTQALPSSPWLSAWFRPRKTIERILAANPRRHVVLLASLGGTPGLNGTPAVLARLIDDAPTSDILDWRVMLAFVVPGAAIGVVGLYIYAFFLRWSGKLIGGHASTCELRATLAWGSVPNVIALAICLLSLAAIRLFAGASEPIEPALSVTLQAITYALALWSLIVMMLMLACVQRFGFWRSVVNFMLGAIVPALAAMLIIRSFFFQAFSIPSAAMEPTLLVGDHLFASKFSYGYSRFSFPFSPPLFSGRILGREPERGDIVVFRLPKDDSADYIKRVVGLPGDRIQMIDGLLHINDVPVKRERISDWIDTEEGGRRTVVKRWQETLPNGVSYTTLDMYDGHGFLDNTQVYEVPLGNYFMMGDNRDNSQDSRVLGQVGYIPLENIVGRAAILYLSIDRKAATPAIRFERLGASVQ